MLSLVKVFEAEHLLRPTRHLLNVLMEKAYASILEATITDHQAKQQLHFSIPNSRSDYH